MKLKIEHDQTNILFPRLEILKNGGHLSFWVKAEDVPNKIFWPDNKKSWKKDKFISYGKIEFKIFIHKKFIYPDWSDENLKNIYIPENFKYNMRFAKLHWKDQLNKELKITGKELVNKYFKHDIVKQQTKGGKK